MTLKKRSLNLFDTTFLIAGFMIGLVVWILSGIITLFAALSFGELTTLICIDLLVYKTFNCGMGLLIIALGVPVYFMFKRSKNANQ